jgi:hypothetical protein
VIVRASSLFNDNKITQQRIGMNNAISIKRRHHQQFIYNKENSQENLFAIIGILFGA